MSRFLAIWLPSLVGIASFVPVMRILFSARKSAMPVSLTAALALAGLQAAIAVGIAAVLGVRLTPLLGLRSVMADAYAEGRPVLQALGFRTQVLPGIIFGSIAAGAAFIASPSFMSYLRGMPVYSRVLYGGIVEEVVFRWGLMSIVAWILWRVLQRGQGMPEFWIMGAAIVIANAVFAFAHVPMLTAAHDANPYRTASIIFVVALPWGWLFWRKGFEAAVIAHATFHAMVTVLLLSS